jgi:hypothetical protein
MVARVRGREKRGRGRNGVAVFFFFYLGSAMAEVVMASSSSSSREQRYSLWWCTREWRVRVRSGVRCVLRERPWVAFFIASRPAYGGRGARAC